MDRMLALVVDADSVKSRIAFAMFSKAAVLRN
jgi:hypothetical protein